MSYWDQITGEVMPRAIGVEVSTSRDHRRQLTRAIGDGQWLVDARQAQGRQGVDLNLRQPDLVVDVGRIAERSELEHAGDRQPRRYPWMVEEESRQMATGRPPGQDDGPGNAMHTRVAGEPVKRSSQLASDRG